MESLSRSRAAPSSGLHGLEGLAVITECGVSYRVAGDVTLRPSLAMTRAATVWRSRWRLLWYASSLSTARSGVRCGVPVSLRGGGPCGWRPVAGVSPTWSAENDHEACDRQLLSPDTELTSLSEPAPSSSELLFQLIRSVGVALAITL